MSTGMERIKTLTSLRLSTVEMPEDFNELELDKQVCILSGPFDHFLCEIKLPCRGENTGI